MKSLPPRLRLRRFPAVFIPAGLVLLAGAAFLLLTAPLNRAAVDLARVERMRQAGSAADQAVFCAAVPAGTDLAQAAARRLSGFPARLAQSLGSAHTRLLLGQARCALGDYPAAERAFSAYVQARPADPLGLIWLGAAQAAACAPAVPAAPQLPPEAVCPDEAARRLVLANWQQAGQGTHFMTESAQQAQDALDPAAALRWANWGILSAPDASAPWKARAAALAGLAAITAASPNPENAPAVWEAAAFAYGRAYQLNQADIDAARSQAALLLEHLARPQDAVAIVDPIARDNPLDIAALDLLGRAAEALGDPDRAEQAYTSAARAARQLSAPPDPAKPEAVRLPLADSQRARPFVTLGEFYLRQERLDDARSAFQEAGAHDPYARQAAWANWGLGRIALKEDQPDKAAAFFTRALQSVPPGEAFLQSQLYYGQAQAALALGNPQAAVEALQTAVALDPNNPGLQVILAQTLVSNGQKAEALAVYRAYLEKWPGDTAAAAALDALNKELNVP